MHTKTHSLIANVLVGDNPLATPLNISISPDEKFAYITNFGFSSQPGKTVSVIDTKTHVVIATVSVEDNPSTIAFTPDSKIAYILNTGNSNFPGNTVFVK
ncbi:YncE family protein [Cytobacillus sp. IB215316]|uniref:YncE family protein n=1 Tax=Cytobacillus sp. IB215316 TaxID=3097354 RepID=UPI0039B787C8